MSWGYASAVTVENGTNYILVDWSVWFKSGTWNNYGQLVRVTDSLGRVYHNEVMGSLATRTGRVRVNLSPGQAVTVYVHTSSTQGGEDRYTANASAWGVSREVSIIKSSDFTVNKQNSTETTQYVDFNITKIVNGEVVRAYNVNPPEWLNAVHSTKTQGYYILTGLSKNTQYEKYPGLARSTTSEPAGDMRVSVPAYPKYTPITIDISTIKHDTKSLLVSWKAAENLGNLSDILGYVRLKNTETGEVFFENPINIASPGSHIFPDLPLHTPYSTDIIIKGKYFDGTDINEQSQVISIGVISKVVVVIDGKEKLVKGTQVWNSEKKKWEKVKDQNIWIANVPRWTNHNGYIDYKIGGEFYCDKFSDLCRGECISTCYFVVGGVANKRYRLQLKDGFRDVVIKNNGDKPLTYMIGNNINEYTLKAGETRDLTVVMQVGKNYITPVTTDNSFEVNYILRKKVF